MAYRNPALTVDALVARRSLLGRYDVLLIKRGRDPFKDHWAFPGGFVDYGEDPKRAVTRELEEETHLTSTTDPVLVSVRGDPSRDPRQHIVTIGYAVKVDPSSLKNLRGDDDACDAKWIPLDDACDKEEVKLAFDHRALANEFRDWFLHAKQSGCDMEYFVNEERE